jgi:hypothetical protein
MLERAHPRLLAAYQHFTINATRLMARKDVGRLNKSRLVCYMKNTMQLCDEDPIVEKLGAV